MTKRQLLLAGGLLPAWALAACGPLQPPAAPPAAKAPKTVIFHSDWVSPARAETIKRAMERWAQEHPTIKIDQQLYAAGTGQSFIEGLVARIASDTIGDVALWEATSVELWARRNAFADITPVLKKLKYNLDDHYYLRDTIFWEGKQLGMPFQFTVSTFQYNRTLFQRHQVPEPQEGWSWDDVIEAAKRLTFPDQNQWGFAFFDSTWWWLTRQFGGEMLSADRKRTLFDTPPNLAALEFSWDLIHRHRVAPTFTEMREKQLDFLKNHFGIWWQGSTNPPGLVKQVAGAFEVDYAPLPILRQTGKRVSSMFDQPHLVMARSLPHGVMEEATQLALFMAGDYVGGLLAELNPGGMPSKKTVLNSPIFLTNPPRNSRRILDSLRYAVPSYPMFSLSLFWINAWRPISRRMLDGELSPRQAAQEMTAAGDAALARGEQ